MLSKDEFESYCESVGLTESGKFTLHEIRDGLPKRVVQGNGGNVTAAFPSKKMLFSENAESHRAELPGIVEYERSNDVFEFYDQAWQLKIVRTRQDGKKFGVWTTVDFCVLYTTHVDFEEWKPELKLVELAKKYPSDYIKTLEGKWRFLPGELAAAQYGMKYVIRSTDDINWNFQRNVRALQDYWRNDCPEVPLEIHQEIFDGVAAKPGITVQEFCNKYYDDDLIVEYIYIMIAKEVIYFDLYQVPLVERSHVHLFRDKETAEAFQLTYFSPEYRERVKGFQIVSGAKFFFHNVVCEIVVKALDTIGFKDDTGQYNELSSEAFERLVLTGKITGLPESDFNNVSDECEERIINASREALEEAQQRLKEILNSERLLSSTKRRWKHAYQLALERCGNGLVGLIPRKDERGNKNSKVPKEIKDFAFAFIQEHYRTGKAKNKSTVFRAYETACTADTTEDGKVNEYKQKGLLPASKPTFFAWIDQEPQYELTRDRMGSRAGYPLKPFYRTLLPTTPRHGDRVLEIVHLDFTTFDIQLTDSRTGKPLGRPTGVFIRDSYSRRILVAFPIFGSPKYSIVLLAIRELIRKFNRCPHIIVVDHGKEFQNVYVDTLLAYLGIIKETRPVADPRYGTPVENIIGIGNKELIHQLEGNTKIMTRVREVTKGFDPIERRTWPLQGFTVALQTWAYEIYDTQPQLVLGQSPRDAFNLSLKEMGLRNHTLIPYTKAFYILTLPPTKRKNLRVHPTKGIKIQHIYYWCTEMARLRGKGKQRPTVEVRHDPFDRGVAYALIDGVLRECKSEFYSTFHFRSETEIRMATQELVQLEKEVGRSGNLNGRKLAEFLRSVEARELLLKQQRYDAENREALGYLYTTPDSSDTTDANG